MELHCLQLVVVCMHSCAAAVQRRANAAAICRSAGRQSTLMASPSAQLLIAPAGRTCCSTSSSDSAAPPRTPSWCRDASEQELAQGETCFCSCLCTCRSMRVLKSADAGCTSADRYPARSRTSGRTPRRTSGSSAPWRAPPTAPSPSTCAHGLLLPSHLSGKTLRRAPMVHSCKAFCGLVSGCAVCAVLPQTRCSTRHSGKRLAGSATAGLRAHEPCERACRWSRTTTASSTTSCGAWQPSAAA